MGISATAPISIRTASGAGRSINEEVSSVDSGSLVTLSTNAVTYNNVTSSPYGMLEFLGYAHTFATSYFTALNSRWESDGFGQVTSAAVVHLKVIYESSNINIYAKTSGGDDEAGGPSNTPGTSYTLAYRVSNAPTGYTARYSYSHTSGDGPFPWDTGNSFTGTQEGFISGTGLSTVASSIGSGVTMSLHAESSADNDFVSTSNEIGTVTLHLEKSGETTYTWPGALNLLSRSSSID